MPTGTMVWDTAEPQRRNFDPIEQDLDAQIGPDIQAIALTFTPTSTAPHGG